jgi:hypothetical protein
MLGSYPTTTTDREYLERLEQLLKSIEYAAPETRNERRATLISEARMILREWRNQ